MIKEENMLLLFQLVFCDVMPSSKKKKEETKCMLIKYFSLRHENPLNH